MIKIYQDLLRKNGLKFMINQKKIKALTKKSELMLRSDLCNFIDLHIVVKGAITVTSPDNAQKK